MWEFFDQIKHFIPTKNQLVEERNRNELKEATENKITILGSIPPRDVLAAETPENVAKATKEMLAGLTNKSRLVVSCAGGMPPNVSTANIKAFCEAVG